MNTPTRRSFIATALAALASFFGLKRTASSTDRIIDYRPISITPKAEDGSRMDFNITVRLVTDGENQFYRMVITSEKPRSEKQSLALESGVLSVENTEPHARLELFYNTYAVLCRQYSESALGEKWTGPSHPWDNVYLTQNGPCLPPTILAKDC